MKIITICSSFLLTLNLFALDLSDIGINNPEPLVKLSDRKSNSSLIKIAVIDSGVDYNHPELSHSISYHPNYPIGYDVNEADLLPYDNHYGYKPQFEQVQSQEQGWSRLRSLGNSLLTNSIEVIKSIMLVGSPGHGTHVSGIALEHCQGTCSLFPIKVFGKNELNPQLLIDAIEIADEAGAQVVNMSLGLFEELVPDSALFERIKEVMLEKDHMIFVVAAGNDGADLSNRSKGRIFPAMINADHILTVGSVDKDSKRSQFSNYSSEYIDVYAEGEDILSTWPGGETKVLSGTSMASPKVAGEMARLWSENQNLTAGQITQKFLHGSKN